MHFSTGLLASGFVLAYASVASASPFRVAYAGDAAFEASLKSSTNGPQCPAGPTDPPYGQFNTNKKIYWNDYSDPSQGTTSCGKHTGPDFASGNYVALDKKYGTEVCGKKVVIVFDSEQKFIEAEVIDLSDFDENLREGGCDGVVLAKQTFSLIGNLDQGVYDGSWIISKPYDDNGHKK